MINLFFLKTFVDTVKTGSVKTSAHKNFVTQPAVSQHIRLIEKHLDCRLFERHNRKITLTPAGQAFLPYAENLLRQYEESLMRLREINGKFSGTISLATIYSIGLYHLQPIVHGFLKKYPKINIRLEYHTFDVIYEKIANQTIDFGFVAYPKSRPGIHAEVFAEERMVLAQSPGHRVFKKRRILLSELHKARFVGFSEHTPTRKTVNAFLNQHGILPAFVNEYDNIETLKSAMTLGIGCSIVPLETLKRELIDGSLEIVHVDGLDLNRPLGLLYARGKTFTESAKEFHAMVLKKSS